MTIPSNRSMTEISAEVERARRKFPDPRGLIVALMEEVGELAQAMLQHGSESERAKEEAIQVACVAIRILEEGDPMHLEPLEDTKPGIQIRVRPLTEPEAVQFQVYRTGGCLAQAFSTACFDWISALGLMLDGLHERGQDPELILMGPKYQEAYKAYLGTLPAVEDAIPGKDGEPPEPEMAFRGLPVELDVDCPTIWMGPDIRRKS